jgi:hypothetical protein
VADGKNEAFIADPVSFIRQNTIDITRFDSSVLGTLNSSVVPREDVWFSMLKSVTAGLRNVAFDLVPRSHGGFLGIGSTRFCMLRFDRSTFDAGFVEKVKELKAKKSYEALTNVDATFAVRGANQALPAWARWVNAKQALDSFQERWTDHLGKFVTATAPIQAYFFPYLSPPGGAADVSRGTWGITDMGFVDVPRRDPEYDFVFTGMMNGCALVIADSPLGSTHFRIFHYPNVSSFPRFMDVMSWCGKLRRMVWTVQEYGSAQDPNAFNFLHYDRDQEKWYLCCQPQTQVRTDSGTIMTIRRKIVHGVALPGRIPLTSLKNYFRDDYVES